MRLPSKVYSDFDGTIVKKNAAQQLIKHYFLHGKDPFWERFLKCRHLFYPRLRRRHMDKYYEVLDSIPKRERAAVLRGLPIQDAWKQAIDSIDGKIRLTIISRNSVTPIHEWLAIHHKQIEDLGVTVEKIIANSPVEEDMISTVVEKHDHLKHLSFGQMQMAEKHEYVPKDCIYIGDADDVVLEPYVKQFIRV